MVMGRECWAVCCGALRNEFELYTTLALLCDFRKQNLIEGIVISTWKGDADRIEGLSERLRRLNIFLVESQPFDEELAAYTNLNAARQLYQLRKGLEILPEDAFVLKCRTDFSHDSIRAMREVFEGKTDLTLGKFGGLKFGLKYRIAVMRMACNPPLTMDDTAFVGYRSDLMKMTKMIMDSLQNNVRLIPDYRMFVNLFVDTFPIMDDIVSLINLNEVEKMSARIELISAEKGKGLVLPDIFNKFYALYFIILQNCFCMTSPRRQDDSLKQFYLSDVFSCNQEIGMVKNWPVSFRNLKAVEMLVNGECFLTEGYLKLYREIMKFADDDYARQCRITKQDYDGAYAWIRDVLKLDVKSFLRPFPAKAEKAAINDAGFSECMNLLLAGKEAVRQKEELLYSCGHSALGSTGGFYRRICDQIPFLMGKDKALDPSILGSAGRGRVSWLLKMIARNAYECQEEEEGRKIGYAFERWGNKATFYRFPMKGDYIAALYYYSMFQERFSKNVIGKNWYTRFKGYYKEEVSNEIKCYSAEMLNQIKAKINQRYSELENAQDIRYMVNFWVDERSMSELSAECEEYLRGYAAGRRASLPFVRGQEDALELLLQYGNTIETPEEAEAVAETLLREKANMRRDETDRREKKQQIDGILEKYARSGLIQPSVIGKINSGELSCGFFQGKGAGAEDMSCYEEIGRYTEERFILLCSVLREKKNLGAWKEKLMQCCDTDKKRFVLALFQYMEKLENFYFLCYRQAEQLWVNFTDPKYRQFEREHFILPRNEDGFVWPYTQKGSESPVAVFFTWTSEGFRVRAEFTAIPSLAKRYFIEAVHDKLALKENSAINVLMQETYRINEAFFLEDAVGCACEKIRELGKIVETAYDTVISRLVQDNGNAK